MEGIGLGIIFLHGRPLTHTFIRQPLNGEERIRSPVVLYKIFGDRSGGSSVFSASTSVFPPVNIILTFLHHSLHLTLSFFFCIFVFCFVYSVFSHCSFIILFTVSPSVYTAVPSTILSTTILQ